MNLQIENLGNLGNLEIGREVSKQGFTRTEETAGAEGAKTFGQLLQQSVEKVNELQHQADDAVKELVAGRSKNIHETLLAVERADTSFKLMMQVRNKVLDAYREIMRMQV